MLIREKLILNDKRMDIADRVAHADDLLATIGQPYGRGADKGNDAWTVFYYHWNKYLVGYRDRVGKRRWYKVEKMARVKDWIEVEELEEKEDGTNAIVSKFVELVRDVHEDTWAARRMLDESKKNKDGGYPDGYRPMEFVEWVPQRDERILKLLDELGFDQVAHEQVLLLEGEALIARAMNGLNLAWSDKDTPGQAADVFMMQAPAREGGTMEYPAQGGRGSNAQTGVHR